jgi:integrase
MIITSLFTKELQDVLAICLAFGLRRVELESLRYKDINVTEKEITIIVHSVTGRHTRTIVANKTYEQEFREVIQQKGAHNPEDLFIEHKIPKAFGFHTVRAIATKSLYKELEGELSKTEVLKRVAQFLGHNRIDIAKKYYLK